MRNFVKIVAALSLALLLSSCSTAQQPKAKYVFLFIGDGMGVAQVYSTEVYKAAMNGKIGHEPLSFSEFPVKSYCTTYSANSFTTCSSAAATAISTGVKTNNSFIGVDTDTLPIETIAEKAKKAGYKVGLMTTVAINHATPGGFYAHQPNRNMYYEIANDMLTCDFDYFASGGFLTPTGKKKDKTNIYTLLDSAGFKVTKTIADFESLKNGDQKVVVVNPATFGTTSHWAIDNVEGSLPLAAFVKKGIELLDNPKGFFIMCEGGKIDYACHNNDLASAIHETIDFEKAVAEAVKFYNQHPDETIIIVTADHETAGLTLASSGRYSINPEWLQYQTISIDSFNVKVKNWAKQPQKIGFENMLDSLQFYFGIGNEKLPLSASEQNWLHHSYQADFLKNKVVDPNKDYMDVSVKGLGERAIYLLNKKSGFAFASGDHSALFVPIYALGQGQEYFKSGVDNTDIPKIIEKLMIEQ